MREILPSTIQKKLSSKLILISGIIVLIFIAVNFSKNWTRDNEVKEEIKGLKQKIQTLQKDNLELSELIEYLNSTAYLEEKARTDLGLKKEGEKTLIIPDSEINEKYLNSITTTEVGHESGPVSNPRKWWIYFFVRK